MGSNAWLAALLVLAGILSACGRQSAGAPSAAPSAATVAASGSTVSADEQAYLAATAQITQAIGNSLDKVQALMASANPSDPAWQQQVSAELALWHQAYRQAQALRVPGELATAHAAFLAALASYDAAATDIAAALQSWDASRLTSAKQELQSANRQIAQAGQLLRQEVSR